MPAERLINVVGLTVFTVALAVGQLLFKRVGLAVRDRPIVDGIVVLAHQPAFYAALAIYGLSTLLWIWILSRVPLMQAYPWAAAGMAIVPLVGWYVFGERVAPLFWLGIVLILLGILLTQYATRAS